MRTRELGDQWPEDQVLVFRISYLIAFQNLLELFFFQTLTRILQNDKIDGPIALSHVSVASADESHEW